VDGAGPGAGTQVTVLTPIAAGAIAVVQVAGPGALAIAETVFRPTGGRRLSQYNAGRMAYGQFLDADMTVVDDGLAVWGGSGPQTWVQFNLHGGVRIVQRVVCRALALGAELRAGETSAGRGHWTHEDRAFDWLCPLERAMQACLAQAATPRVVQWLIRQQELWQERVADWQRRLVAGEIASVLAEAQGLLAEVDLGGAWRGRTLAIVGLPNVGKSTIANRLAGRAVSLVADLHGTTRDWVGEPISLLGWPVWMVDTAGLRPDGGFVRARPEPCLYSNVGPPAWRPGSSEHADPADPKEVAASEGPAADIVAAQSAARALEQAGRADLRLLVLDSTCATCESENWLVRKAGLRSCDVIAWTKCDLPVRDSTQSGRIDLPPGIRQVRISGLTGAGWYELERALAQGFGFSALQEPKSLVFCAEVQVCVTHMVSAIQARKPAEALAAVRCLIDRGAASGSDGHAEPAR